MYRKFGIDLRFRVLCSDIPELVLDGDTSRAKFSKFKQRPMSIEEFLATSMSATQPDGKKAIDCLNRGRKVVDKDHTLVSAVSRAVSILGFMKTKRDRRNCKRL